MSADKRVAIYDTTLRDGAQGEGVTFSTAGKVRLARRLDELGVDYIEGGFPGSNRKEAAFFEQMREVDLRHARLVAFCSTRRAGKPVGRDPALRSALEAGTPAVTVYGKTWKLHVRDVLRTTLKENFAMISETVRYLKDRDREVLFDAEHFFDGYKHDPAFALDAVGAAVEAGADVVVLCDTNGGCLPHEVGEAVRSVAERCDVQIGIHTHDDTGLAVANALEAVRAGATHVQGTINGYGERCGNANLCTIVPALMLKMGRTCLRPRRLRTLRAVSLFVDELVNLRHNAKAPFVGSSAFAHKAGAHVNAVRKNPLTFEHVEPGAVGNERHILVSELSGGSSVLLKAVELGMGRQESEEGAREILAALKNLEARGYVFEAADASFRILVQKVLKKHRSFFDLEGFRVIVEKRGKDEPCISEATVKVRVNGEIEQTVSEGDGPVDALNGALRRALTRFYPSIAKVHLTDFRVRILDPEESTAATTRVLIESGDGEATWGTVGVSDNIIEASWEALVDSVEYKLFKDERTETTGSRPARAPRRRSGSAG
jgi:2-isopropylmalate synthase